MHSSVLCCASFLLAICLHGGETIVIERAAVDINRMVKVRIADGLPGDRTEEGDLRVLGTNLILDVTPNAEVEMPYWAVRRLCAEDAARLNPSQSTVVLRLREATEAWRLSRQKIVDAERAVQSAQLGVKQVENSWASTRKMAEKAKRPVLPSETRSLDMRMAAATKRVADAQGKLATVQQSEGAEEARLRSALCEAWKPVLLAFQRTEQEVDLGELAKPVETPRP
jgi:hypothetical protein